MRNALLGTTRHPKLARIATTGITALGAAGIATTALAGTAQAASAPAKPATKASVKDLPSAAHAGHKSTDQAVAAKDVKGVMDVKAAKAKDAKPAKADKPAEDNKAAKASKSDAGDEGKKYADNLDGWIREARDIMKDNDIPGSYDGIKRNIVRESAGDPDAVNDWDVNAQKGTPSRGLLQVIQPTFDRFHVKGTPDKLTDPVANIVAACNYAADRYGSMDKVDSAY